MLFMNSLKIILQKYDITNYRQYTIRTTYTRTHTNIVANATIIHQSETVQSETEIASPIGERGKK